MCRRIIKCIVFEIRKEKKVRERNYGLDFVRILAMVGIIILHIIGQGGVINNCEFGSPRYIIVWWIKICAISSVDLFALLSGWLGIFKSKASSFRTFELILTVFFYSVLITVGFSAFYPETIRNLSDVMKSVVPALAGRYWYITCYIPLAVLQPFINSMILSLSIRQHRTLCVLCTILFSLIPSLVAEDLFVLKGGYSAFWLIIVYVIGAYLKRINAEKRIKISLRVGLSGIISISLVLLLGNLFLKRIAGEEVEYFVQYTSPAILLMAVLMLIASKEMKITRYQREISSLASKAFDVYIIHCHILIYDYVFKEGFIILAKLALPLIPISIFLLALIIYFMLSCVGYLRGFIFDKLYITQNIKRLAFQVDRLIY